MAAPIWGVPPKIRQENDSIVVYDTASWFDQEGTKATRWVSVWFWNGVNIFGTPTPPWATNPDHVQPGENLLRLPLGPTNIRGVFYVVEFGGIVSPAFGDNPAAVEWGREWSGNRDDLSKWGARSNTVIVEDWRPATPPPIVPIPRTSTQVRNEAVALFKSWEQSQSGPLELTRIRIAREVLELKDPDWNAVRQSFRVELDQLREEE